MVDGLINFVLRGSASCLSRLRIIILRLLGARIGPNCRLESIQVPRNPWDIDLAEGVALDRDVVLLATGQRASKARISIGARSYVNRWAMIDASCLITIGADVMIGPGTYITDHDHGTGYDLPPRELPLVEAATIIEDNVWIGANATILKGVTIGKGAVIGAGSVVTKPVTAGDRVAGVPARSMIVDRK